MPHEISGDPFVSARILPDVPPLRVPQARVLKALMPAYHGDPVFEWPLCTRSQLGCRAGYSGISGTLTRALNGIRQGNKTSGDPHPGVIDQGFVEVVKIDVDGVMESNYRITQDGIMAYQAYTLVYGDCLPPVKDAATCVNDRYRGE